MASNLALRRSELELKDLFESFVRTMVSSLDSLAADRPCRDAQGEDHAVSELKRLAGSHFDPELVQTFPRALGRKAILGSEG